MMVVLLVISSCSSFMAGGHAWVRPSCRGASKLAFSRWQSYPSMQLQVVTDIDDTVKSSGGVALLGIPLGGVDTSYQRNSFYPGVFSFGAELSANAKGFKRRPPSIAVLTARAEEFKWALEIKQSDKICTGFRDAGRAIGLGEGWGIGPVLYGSVAEWVCQERKGWRKFENFKKLFAANSQQKLQYVFVGDNGSSEKDIEAAQRIIGEFPDALRAVFVHAVSGERQPAPLPEDHDIEGVPVRYFRTYPTAAAKAERLGLMSARAVRRVCDAVEAEMKADTVNILPGSQNERLLLDELAKARGLPRRRIAGALASIWRRRPSLGRSI